MEYFELISVPIIATLVYGVITLLKTVFGEKEMFCKLTPIISATLGVVFGIIAFYCAPNIIPASNILSAILIGASSGLTATGTHQIFKQLSRKDFCEKTDDVIISKESDEVTEEKPQTKEDGTIENQ